MICWMLRLSQCQVWAKWNSKWVKLIDKWPPIYYDIICYYMLLFAYTFSTSLMLNLRLSLHRWYLWAARFPQDVTTALISDGWMLINILVCWNTHAYDCTGNLWKDFSVSREKMRGCGSVLGVEGAHRTLCSWRSLDWGSPFPGFGLKKRKGLWRMRTEQKCWSAAFHKYKNGRLDSQTRVTLILKSKHCKSILHWS